MKGGGSLPGEWPSTQKPSDLHNATARVLSAIPGQCLTRPANDLRADHGPGGGHNPHTWCRVLPSAIEWLGGRLRQ